MIILHIEGRYLMYRYNLVLKAKKNQWFLVTIVTAWTLTTYVTKERGVTEITELFFRTF